jgi:hypothetical protein
VIQSEPSLLSLVAAAFYVIVMGACLLALTTALRQKQVRWHVASWMLLAGLFAGLAIMRAFAIEEVVRDELRFLLHAEGKYEDRRALQGMAFAAMFVSAAAIGGFRFFQVTRTIQGRRNVASTIADAGGAGLLLLLMLRIVSLHSVDQFLYGPLKLNWLIDLGASALVLGCSIYYWQVVTGRLR